MKQRKIIFTVCAVALVVTTFLGLLHPSPVRAQVDIPINIASAVWVTYDSTGLLIPIDAMPGDTKIPLRVKIQNIGNATISGVSAYILLDYPFRNITGGNLCRSFYSTALSPGTSAEADFTINIDTNAKPGEYRLKVTFNYLEQATGVGKTLYFLRSVDVIAPVVITATKFMAIYDVVLSPPTTVPAGNLTIAGNVLNTGKVSAYNTNISVTSPILGRGASTIVGQVDPNVPRPFSFRLQVRPNVTPGAQTIVISCAYADVYGVNHIAQFQARIFVRPAEPPRPIVTQKPTDPLSILIEIIRDVIEALFGFRTMSPI